MAISIALYMNSYNTIECRDKIIYAIFKDKFKEPIEVMYFLMDDMNLYKITSNYENRISFRIWELKERLANRGYKISNIIAVIHNHTKRAYFSRTDIVAYKLFKGEGFDGKFYLYVYRNKKIYELIED